MAKLHLTLYRDDTLHLEHGEIDKGEVFRRSELDPFDEYMMNIMKTRSLKNFSKNEQVIQSFVTPIKKKTRTRVSKQVRG